jgi:hypothetical protein
MGCFDYECACGGETCPFKGGQDGGSSTVVIEVPLKDGTRIFVTGTYDSYGSVQIGEYRFYAEQFEDYFEGWLSSESDKARSKIFLAKRIWTTEYVSLEEDDTSLSYGSTVSSDCYSGSVDEFNPTDIEKCTRADTGLDILSDDDRQKARIAHLKKQIEFMQKELGRINKP